MKNDKFYHRVHDFVRREKPKALKCEHCGLEKKLENALIRGKSHAKNTDNYISLCRKCHYHYDHPNGFKHSEESKVKIGASSSERIKEKGVNINFINAQKGNKASDETKLKMSLAKIKDIVHGTLTGYKHYKCKCELCTKANTEYCVKYNKRKNGKI